MLSRNLLTTVFSAAKYNESEEHLPELAVFEEITKEEISNESVLNHEIWALQRLGWKLNGTIICSMLCEANVK